MQSGTKMYVFKRIRFIAIRYAQCRGQRGLRALAHLLAAHSHTTPKQAKEPTIATRVMGQVVSDE